MRIPANLPKKHRALVYLAVIIALSVLPRLYRLTSPHILDFHSWRQGDSAAFAHGYLRNGLRLLSPTVDRQPCSAVKAPFGQVEAELPINSYLTAIPLRLAGVTYPPAWALRLGSIAFFVATCIYLYQLVRRLGGSAAQALASLGVLSVSPLAIFFTRSPQPDGPTLLLSVALLHHLDGYLLSSKRQGLVLAAASLSLLLLSKVSNAFMLLPAVALVVLRRGPMGTLKAWPIHVAAVVSLVPVAAWYWHASSFAWTFEIWGDRGLSKWTTGKIFWAGETWEMLSNRLTFDIVGWGGVVLVIVGLLSRAPGPVLPLCAIWAGSVLLFVLTTLPAQRRHVYYQLPLVLPASIAAGYGIVELVKRGIWSRLVLVCLALVEIGISWRALVGDKTEVLNPYFRDDPVAAEGVALLRKHVEEGRFVTVDRNPSLFYNSGHQGFFEANPTVPRLLQCAKQGGARHVLLDTPTEKKLSGAADWATFTSRMKKVGIGKHYRVYRSEP